MGTAKVKIIIANFFLAILSIAIVLLIAEFLVRSMYKDETVLFPRYHTDAHYGEFVLRKIRPSSVFWHTSMGGKWKFTINKQGFRNDKDFEYKKKDGVIRVLSLGDSHTQGYEVRQDYTFSAITEKYLHTQGYAAEVINAGISGYSTAEELLFLENEGVRYKPDFVVLGFYANDFQDNIKSNLFKLNENGGLIVQKEEHIPGVRIQNIIYSIPFVSWLSENSYFYSLLFNNTWAFFKTRLSKKASQSVIEYAIPTKDKFSNYETALTSAILSRMYDFCKKNNIKLIIVDIPRILEQDSIDNSFPDSFSGNGKKYSDVYISGKSVLSDFIGVAEIHVPYGHRHISEFTHTILGVNIARNIIVLNK